MRSGNPVLKESVFKGVSFREGGGGAAAVIEAPMTMQGVMGKTAVLLLTMIIAAAFTWQKAKVDIASAQPWMLGGMIGAIALTFIIGFKPKLAPILALPHAALEGLFLGAVSVFYVQRFGVTDTSEGLLGMPGGIVFQAVMLTFMVALTMLGLYSARIIRVTERLRSIVFTATGAVMLYYGLSFVLSMVGLDVLPWIHDGAGPISIGFSVLVIGLAAFFLLIDFDMIEKGVAGGAPKWMEWYGGFALIVTLAWLYLEILRLLAKLQSSND